MASDIVRCQRCGLDHHAPPPVEGFRTLAVCPRCGRFTVVKELGEMFGPQERADPDEFGGLGWA